MVSLVEGYPVPVVEKSVEVGDPEDEADEGESDDPTLSAAEDAAWVALSLTIGAFSFTVSAAWRAVRCTRGSLANRWACDRICSYLSRPALVPRT